MTLQWSALDVKAGTKVTKAGIGELWIIGYVASKKDRFALVSLSDGCITLEKNREGMAKGLSEEGYIPTELIDKYDWRNEE